MSAHGDVTFDWGDGTYTFRLGLGEIRQLQEKTGLGPLALFNRIDSDNWMVDDLRETLRLGLVGFGMKDAKALALIKANFDERPKINAKEPAMRILHAFLLGAPEDPVGKPQAAEHMNGQPAPTAGSASPHSTGSAVQ